VPASSRTLPCQARRRFGTARFAGVTSSQNGTDPVGGSAGTAVPTLTVLRRPKRSEPLLLGARGLRLDRPEGRASTRPKRRRRTARISRPSGSVGAPEGPFEGLYLISEQRAGSGAFSSACVTALRVPRAQASGALSRALVLLAIWPGIRPRRRPLRVRYPLAHSRMPASGVTIGPAAPTSAAADHSPSRRPASAPENPPNWGANTLLSRAALGAQMSIS